MYEPGFYDDGSKSGAVKSRLYDGNEWTPLIINAVDSLDVKALRGHYAKKIEGVYFGGHPDAQYWEQFHAAKSPAQCVLSIGSEAVHAYVSTYLGPRNQHEVVVLAERWNDVEVVVQYGHEAAWLAYLPETAELMRIGLPRRNPSLEVYAGVVIMLGEDWSTIVAVPYTGVRQKIRAGEPQKLLDTMAAVTRVERSPSDSFKQRCLDVQRSNLTPLDPAAMDQTSQGGQWALPCRYRGGHPGIPMKRAQVVAPYWFILDRFGLAISTERNAALSGPPNDAIVAAFPWPEIQYVLVADPAAQRAGSAVGIAAFGIAGLGVRARDAQLIVSTSSGDGVFECRGIDAATLRAAMKQVENAWPDARGRIHDSTSLSVGSVSAGASQPTAAQRLRELSKLLDDGFITETEFHQRRAILLEEL